MSNIRYEISTNINKGNIIEQTVRLIQYDIIEDITHTITNIQEEQIKQALINLGWTPPSIPSTSQPPHGTQKT